MIGLGMQNILLFGLGMQEILVIAFIVLLLFGGKKIPELMKGLGKGVKSFKEGMNEVKLHTRLLPMKGRGMVP